MPLDFEIQPSEALQLGEPHLVVDSPATRLSTGTVATRFDRFIDLMQTDEQFRSVCNDLMENLNTDPDVRRHYGGFFKNKFQNREDDIGYDDKVVWQASGECLDYLELGLSMLGYQGDPVRDAVLMAQKMLKQGTELMRSTIENVCLYYPELTARLLCSEREWPVTVRLMRYCPHENLATNPHVDKTVLSTIIWNSDPNQDQRLAFPRTQSDASDVSQYRAIGCRGEDQHKPAYVFWGAALSETGYSQPASPHAVLPVDEDAYRYSIAVFWLLPELDLSDFSTAIPYRPNSCVDHVPTHESDQPRLSMRDQRLEQPLQIAS